MMRYLAQDTIIFFQKLFVCGIVAKKAKRKKKIIWVKDGLGYGGKHGLSVLQRELKINKCFRNENI